MNKRTEKRFAKQSDSQNRQRLYRYAGLLNECFEKHMGSDLERGDKSAGGNRKQDH